MSTEIAREARLYRRWKTSILWTTTIAYAIALFACLLSNIGVNHTLSWFWVVLGSVAVGFSLTTLPLMSEPRVRQRGWLVLGAFTTSLVALLAIVRLVYGNGGGDVEWLPIAVASILFAVVAIFSPIVLWLASLPSQYEGHRTVLALAIDTVALFGLLLVVFVTNGRMEEFGSKVIPTTLLSLVFAWVGALVICYVPLSGLNKAAILTAFTGLYEYFAFQPALRQLYPDSEPQHIDLSQWNETYLNGNISLLTMLGLVLAAAVLAALAPFARPRSAPRAGS